MASAPAMSVADRVPPAMSPAARLTSHWGEFPPMVVTSQSAPAMPSRAASSVAGAGPVWVMMSTTDRRPMADRRRGASRKAASEARSIRSTGVTSSVRSMDWPDAMTTGIRSGSRVVSFIGRSWTRAGSRAQATIATRQAPSPVGCGPPAPPSRWPKGVVGALSPNGTPTQGTSHADLSGDFLFGVATAGFQIEGGYNGPGQPSNNWLAWEQVGRVEPSGNAVGFWEGPTSPWTGPPPWAVTASG